jgi:hypothetical protein
MDSLAKEISKPLRHVLSRYKYQMPILHPFEATVADLTVKVSTACNAKLSNFLYQM